MSSSSSSTGRYRVWTADPVNRSKIDHLAELAAAGVDPVLDYAFLDLVDVVSGALGLKPGEAADHVLRIVRERARR